MNLTNSKLKYYRKFPWIKFAFLVRFCEAFGILFEDFMKQIPLSQGKFALVDDEDFEKLNKHKWFFNNRYAVTNIKGALKRTPVAMHRLLIDTKKGMHTDHINRNSIDNRKCNLRTCLPIQNTRNRNKCIRNKSGMRGVSWYKKDQCWHSQIMVNRRQIHLGYYDDILDAAIAYNKASLKYHGIFGVINTM